MRKLSIICKRSDYLDFILSGLHQDVDVVEIKLRESIFYRFFHFLFNGFSLAPRRALQTYITPDSIKRLKAINSDVVIVLGAIDFRLSTIIWRFLSDDIVKHIWLWNEVGKESFDLQSRKFSYNKLHGIITSSFNPADVTTYDLKYVPQVYRYVDGLFQQEQIGRDCYWIGRPKGRISELAAIESAIENQGFKCDFRIIERTEDYINYEENLRLISSSKCLVDLYTATNEGVSLRVMEALFFRKKLITTNKFVKNYDFYHPQNIFIWGVDEVSHLKDFIDSPFVNVDKEIVDKYDINNWIKNFG